MTFKEYTKKRTGMLDSAEALIQQGKLDEALQVKTQIEDLDKQYQQEKEAQEELNALRGPAPAPQKIIDMAGNPEIAEENKMAKVYDATSREYRDAFLKKLKGVQLSDVETEAYRQVNAAFVQTTENTSAVIPTEMLNTIWDLVSGQHPIVGDVNRIDAGCAIDIPIHSSITQGAGKIVDEGVANDDLENGMKKVTLTGKDFSANVDISYATARMAIDALESYLETEIANTIGAAMADHIVSTIDAGISSDNKITSASTGKLTYKDVAGAFAELKRTAEIRVYMSRKTLYTYVATIEDTAGHLIFVPNANDDAAGNLLGGQVKIEDSVADGKMLIGDPMRVPMDVVQDVVLETDRDIKKHTITYAGYARAEAAVADDKAFATLTVKTA